MSHAIHAWLEQGEPRLGILDTETGHIRQLWRLSRIETGPAQQPPVPPTKTGTQQLARELFLISCCEAIGQIMQQPQVTDCQDCRQRNYCHPPAAAVKLRNGGS